MPPPGRFTVESTNAKQSMNRLHGKKDMPYNDAPLPVTISIVIPVYCGSEYLQKLTASMDDLRLNWQARGTPFALAEAIFVDDAAIDNSSRIIDQLAEKHPWIVALHLSRNFGQHPATIVGILHSAGDWVVTLDEDLQHKPELISEMLEKAVLTGSDLVYAHPETGVHDSIIRDLTSRSFKRMMQWLTENRNLPNFNSFRLIRGPIARAAASVCTHDTYLDIALSWFTQRVQSVRTEMKDERYIKTGRSGYTLRSLLSHAWRMIFSSQIKLLRIGALLGLAVMGLAVAGGIYFLGLKLIYPQEIQAQGWTSLFLAIAFFGGLSSFMLGMALQYLSTLVLKAHGKPTFFTIDRSGDLALAFWFRQQSGA